MFDLGLRNEDPGQFFSDQDSTVGKRPGSDLKCVLKNPSFCISLITFSVINIFSWNFMVTYMCIYKNNISITHHGIMYILLVGTSMLKIGLTVFSITFIVLNIFQLIHTKLTNIIRKQHIKFHLDILTFHEEIL